MDHKELNSWKLSIDIVEDIYILTANFPKSETFGLISQMRRAAISIPSNISEGAGRNHDKEMIQFLFISLGSISELDTLLLISERINYINDSILNSIRTKLNKLKMFILGLIKYLKNKH
jgi:four helix bundle protein